MEKYYNLLKQVPLFFDVPEADLPSLLSCLNAGVQLYAKDSFIFRAGDPVSWVGIVCEGGVQVIREDVFGNRTILAKLSEGDLFAETFACGKIDTMPVSVLADDDCAVMMIDYRRIITVCPSACGFHGKLIENMLGVLAQKNLMLNQKIECLSARSTRDKLMTYLLAQAEKARSKSFRIPFSRQELADYLSVDRSAMSSELGGMRNEGLIRFDKNNFCLLHM